MSCVDRCSSKYMEVASLIKQQTEADKEMVRMTCFVLSIFIPLVTTIMFYMSIYVVPPQAQKLIDQQAAVMGSNSN